jgi:hypothetical protein
VNELVLKDEHLLKDRRLED